MSGFVLGFFVRFLVLIFCFVFGGGCLVFLGVFGFFSLLPLETGFINFSVQLLGK